MFFTLYILEQPDNDLNCLPILRVIRIRDYKTFVFMLNSARHETLNAHKYKIFQKFHLFSGSDKPGMLFFMFMNFKMPTNVGILHL